MAESNSTPLDDQDTSIKLRHVTIFTTPAGASSKRFKTLATLSPALRHWGLIFQDVNDFAAGDGLCIELDVDDGRIFPKRTRWSARTQEDNGTGRFQYANTGRFTFWEDDSIYWCARNLCNEQMQGTYNVFDRNCQVLVNLLMTRIIEGGPFDLGQTLGHTFSRKSTRDRLFDTSEFDHGVGAKLLASKVPVEPQWSLADAIPYPQTSPTGSKVNNVEMTSSNSRPALIDLSEADRPEGPLNLDEIRQVAKFWAQEPRQYSARSTNKVFIKNPVDLSPQITGYIKALADSADVETRLQTYGEKVARTQTVGSITPEARENARKADEYFRGYYTNHVSMLRQFSTRAAAMTPYLDPSIPPEVRDDKARRLFALNSDALRQTRVRSLKEHQDRLAKGEGLLGMKRAKAAREGKVVPSSARIVAPTDGCPECAELNFADGPRIACFGCFADAYYNAKESEERSLQCDGTQVEPTEDIA